MKIKEMIWLVKWNFLFDTQRILLQLVIIFDQLLPRKKSVEFITHQKSKRGHFQIKMQQHKVQNSKTFKCEKKFVNLMAKTKHMSGACLLHVLTSLVHHDNTEA